LLLLALFIDEGSRVCVGGSDGGRGEECGMVREVGKCGTRVFRGWREKDGTPPGASFTQGIILSIPIGGSISPEGFLLPILLLVVIIVTVIFIVVAIVGVVIVVTIIGVIIGVVVVVKIIGVVVVIGVFAIIELSFMIISFLRIIVFYYLLNQSLGYGNSFFQGLRFRSGNISFNTSSSLKPINETNNSFCTIEVERLAAHKLLDTMEILEFKISKNRYEHNRMSGSIRGSSGTGLLPSGRGGKKSRESNSDNTRGTKISKAIGACSGGIGNSLVASYACMNSIYGSSCKREKTSVAKRYLVKSFEESGEVFLGEGGK
nr:hypothetical protein [Tanacetum cinerariifolium]